MVFSTSQTILLTKGGYEMIMIKTADPTVAIRVGSLPTF
jgi:hypothetical protein